MDVSLLIFNIQTQHAPLSVVIMRICRIVNVDDRDSDCDGDRGRLGESGAILRDSPRIGLDFRCRSTYL